MLRNPLKLSGLRCGSWALLATASLLSACSVPAPGAEFNDPYEAQNRAVHEDNIAIDRILGGGKPDKKPFLPRPVANGLSNVADNLGTPGAAVNSVLQGRPGPAARNVFRFVINSTVGIAGLFDPATSMGIAAADTDFGETLHVWGARQGAFLVLPLVGPTTERDLAGKVVDALIDPVGAVVGEPESYYIAAAKLGGKVADRQRFGDAIDSILYQSADSYAQMRLLYLQNRDFELGIEADVFDPYEDPYGQ